MKTENEIKSIAIQAIEEEKKAIANLTNYVDERFVKAVQVIYSTSGRVIITGIGKSANIAAKIVSTFNSTGTPALFLHAADALHGDLGMLQPGDTVICLSKSGNTPEIKHLVPLIKSFGNTLIALCGNSTSYLATSADILLDCTVEREACPNNLAPTCSTTAQLVMGDALAVVLMHCRHFTAEDFARCHPGGALGKQLYMKVSDLYKQNESPSVNPLTPMSLALLEMTAKRLGCTAVVDNDNHLLGIITDGDLRRMLNATSAIETLTAQEIMSQKPKTVGEQTMAIDALHLMRDNSITQLVVTDTDNHYLGILHLHDLLKEGIV